MKTVFYILFLFVLVFAGFSQVRAISADLNGDGQVNIADLAIVLSQWGPTNSPAPSASGGPSPTSMPAPPGYSQLIFSDKFSGPTLDSSKWIHQIADEYGIWDNHGALPSPYSASNAGGYNAEYFSPAALSFGASGLTLTAKRDTSQSGYTWQSGCITTHGKFTFQGGYAQFRAKMPDSSTGLWGALWFLEGGAEIDLHESGFTGFGPVNQVIAANLHTTGNTQKFWDSGLDLSADYHIYGMEYLPGQSVKIFFDGTQIAQYTSNVPTGAMTILINLQVAQNAAGWHTVYSSSTPSPAKMYVSEVQVWKK